MEHRIGVQRRVRLSQGAGARVRGLPAPDGSREEDEAVEIDERLAAVHVSEITPEDSSCIHEVRGE